MKFAKETLSELFWFPITFTSFGKTRFDVFSVFNIFIASDEAERPDPHWLIGCSDLGTSKLLDGQPAIQNPQPIQDYVDELTQLIQG